MSVYKYKDFLFESVEKVPLFISPQLISILKKLNLPVSNAILDDINKPQDISYLDCDIQSKEKADKISFQPAAKAFGPPGEIVQTNWTSKTRQEMSVGKIVNKLFPDKFKQTDIEKFINDFKAEIGKSFADFRLVEGEDIRKYYLEDNYENQQQGDINSSCMKHDYAQKYLDIYAKNPEKCKLLILMSDKNPKKIKGRALVWMGTRKPTSRIYMDRIYVINDADEKLYIDYAIEHNWLYKAHQVMHDASYIENGKRVYSSVAIQLNPNNFDKYPSLDTLAYYTPSTGRLGSNAGNFVPGHPRLQLNSAEGDATKLDR